MAKKNVILAPETDKGVWTDALEMRENHREAFMMRKDYWCFR